MWLNRSVGRINDVIDFLTLYYTKDSLHFLWINLVTHHKHWFTKLLMIFLWLELNVGTYDNVLISYHSHWKKYIIKGKQINVTKSKQKIFPSFNFVRNYSPFRYILLASPHWDLLLCKWNVPTGNSNICMNFLFLDYITNLIK